MSAEIDGLCDVCVEFVARALHEHTVSHWGLAKSLLPTWEAQGEPVQETYRREARAAMVAYLASEHERHAER